MPPEFEFIIISAEVVLIEKSLFVLIESIVKFFFNANGLNILPSPDIF